MSLLDLLVAAVDAYVWLFDLTALSSDALGAFCLGVTGWQMAGAVRRWWTTGQA